MQTNTNLPTSDTKTILLTVPGLQDRGGVVSFYNGVLPYFPEGKVMPLEIVGPGDVLQIISSDGRIHFLGSD